MLRKGKEDGGNSQITAVRMAVGQLGWQAGSRGESGFHLVLGGAGEAVTRGEGASVLARLQVSMG